MRTKILATCVVATLIAGCSTATNIRDNDRLTTERESAAQEALEAMRSGRPSVEQGGIRIIDDAIYTPPKPRVISQHQNVPSCSITHAPATSVTLAEVGQTITKVCGIQVRVTPDAVAATADPSGGGSFPASGPAASIAGNASASGIPLPAGVSLPSPVSGTAGMPMPTFGSPFPSSNRIDIRYEGDVTGLLNAVTSRLGLSWRYRDGVATIFHLDTRSFHVFTIPTTTEMSSVVSSGSTTSAGVAGGSGGGGGGGGSTGGVSGQSSSNQVTNVGLRTNSSADLIASVNSMLTPNVGRMSLSALSGLTVTDTPEVLERIEDFVETLNATATKQVLMNVKVLTVTVNDDDEFGVNWTAVYRNLSDQYGIGLVNQFAASADAVSGSVNILEGNSRFSGSQLLVNALSKQGRVSVLTQPSVTTLNLEPVPVQVAKQTSYLAQSSTTLTSDVGQTTSLTPGTITTGFNMSLLPYILPDSQTILLQFSVNLSSLDSIRRVESGDSAIEIPEVDNRLLSQKVRIRSGETLVLSGFEQSTRGSNRSGVGNSRFWLFGGGARANNAREVLVVLITPVVTI